MIKRYILDDNNQVKQVNNWLVWGKWMENNPRSVSVTRFEDLDCVVSTVFLGLDASMATSFVPGLPPMVFETRVFGGPRDGETERCATWEEAVEQHRCECEWMATYK